MTITGKGNYTGTGEAAFSIAKAALTITAEDKSVTFGGEAPEYTVTYDGFVNEEKPEVLGGKLTFNCDYKQGSDAGTYSITPMGLTSDNYEITFVNGTLTVNEPETPENPKDSNTGIAFTSANAMVIFGETFELPKLSNPYNLPVEWLSSNTQVATVDQSGAVKLIGSGVTQIWAIFKGNDSFERISAMYELTVIRNTPVLKFSEESVEATIGQPFAPPTLTKIPEDLEGIKFISSKEEVATVDEATGAVTLRAEGTTEIKASLKEMTDGSLQRPAIP